MQFIGFERIASKLEASVEFYCKALGFEVRSMNDTDAHLALGRESIRLVRGAVSPPKSGVGFHHFAIVTNDMNGSFERLQGYGAVAISKNGPRHLPASSGGVQAFKFRDPDGHPLELIAFPRSSDDDAHLRWTEMGSDELTLGIDHSAIVVSDAEKSIAFYESTLGLHLSSRQTNRGPEQALLDGVEGGVKAVDDAVVVDVVGLSPASKDSPHLELLCYEKPVDFRKPSNIELQSADKMIFLVDHIDGDTRRKLVDPDGYPLEIITRQTYGT